MFVIVVVTAIGMCKVDFRPDSKCSHLMLLNIEALAEDEGGVEDCDIMIYNRNEAEATEIATVRAEAGGGFYIIVNGRKIGLGINATAGGSVKYYYCKESLGNCCKKSWMQKAVEYL